MKIRIIVSLLALVLSGCVTKSNEQLANDAEQLLTPGEVKPLNTQPAAMPDSLRQQLRQSGGTLSAQAQAILDEPRFSVQARDIEARDFFTELAADTAYSIVLHPDVSGTISLNLRDVTLSETLQVIEQMYGYDVRRQGRIFQVYPADMRTETLQLNYLALQRFGTSQTSITQGGVSQMNDRMNPYGGRNNMSSRGSWDMQFGGLLGPQNMQSEYERQSTGNITGQSGSEISTRSETDFWRDLEKALTSVIGEGDGRRVHVSPQAGIATVRAYPNEIRAARDFIEVAERNLQRQVILEARIVEVTLREGFEQGIQWDRLFSSGAVSFGSAGSIGGAFSVSLDDGTFSGVLDLLSTQGNVQVLSSPRVTATNNQKAVIKIGEDEYFVTDVSTTIITGTATTSTPNVQLTPFFSGIALDVTPQIGENGDVILHVHPSVTETTEQEKVIQLNNEQLVLPLAQSNIRETDTIIRARNGEVVVIGGLMQTTYRDVRSQVPLLGSLPLFGALFRQHSQLEEKKELIIMLRPTVVGADTWQGELERSRHLLRDWYSVN